MSVASERCAPEFFRIVPPVATFIHPNETAICANVLFNDKTSCVKRSETKRLSRDSWPLLLTIIAGSTTDEN